MQLRPMLPGGVPYLAALRTIAPPALLMSAPLVAGARGAGAVVGLHSKVWQTVVFYLLTLAGPPWACWYTAALAPRVCPRAGTGAGKNALCMRAGRVCWRPPSKARVGCGCAHGPHLLLAHVENAGLQRRRHRPHAAGLDAAHPPRRPGTHLAGSAAPHRRRQRTVRKHPPRAPCRMAATTGRTTVAAPSNATPRARHCAWWARKPTSMKATPCSMDHLRQKKRAGADLPVPKQPRWPQFFPLRQPGSAGNFTAAARKSCVPALSTHCGASTPTTMRAWRPALRSPAQQ